MGAPNLELDGFTGAGAAHVCVRNGTQRQQQARLVGGRIHYDREGFGYAVGISGDRAVVGDLYESFGKIYPVGARLYPGGSQLFQDAKADYACFGNSVALGKDPATSIVGAPYEGPLGGAASVFAVGTIRLRTARLC